MKLNYSKRILVLVIIMFVGVITLNVTFSNLLLHKISDINDRVSQLDISSQEREKELGLREGIISSKAEREKLAGYFVGEGNVETVEFTKYLEDLALKNNLTQSKSLNYEPVSGLESSSVVSAIRFRFTIMGKWTNIFTFLQLIENLPKVLSLDSVSLSTSLDGDLAKEIRPEARIWQADLDFTVVKLKI